MKVIGAFRFWLFVARVAWAAIKSGNYTAAAQYVWSTWSAGPLVAGGDSFDTTKERDRWDERLD